MLDKVVPHAGELAQVTVVRHCDARAGELERVQVGLGDRVVPGVGDAADVSDEAGRRELGSQVAEVLIEARQRRHAIGERIVGIDGPRIPGRHAEARQVEEGLHHPGAVGLAYERAVGLEQNVRERDRLSEIREHPAHRPIV